MLAEQHELLFGRRRPHLPVLDTRDIVRHMPAGSWEIPQVPYTLLERIEENDLDSLKAYKIERFQGHCRRLVACWIPFLGSVERGDQMLTRFMEEHVLTTDSNSIENYDLFKELFAPKFDEDYGLEFKDVLSSVRNAFLYLLTEEEAKTLGYEKPAGVTQKDIEYATFLVNRFAGNL